MIDEQKFREKKILETLYIMSSLHSQWLHIQTVKNEIDLEDRDEWKYDLIEDDILREFANNAEYNYRCILAYLESLNLKEYLADFKREFSLLISEKRENALLECEYDENSGENYSKIVSRFWHYLGPFKFSDSDYIDSLLRESGVIYLEHILRNTQVILNEMEITPNSEAQVYNSVKFVIKTVFPDACNPNSNFNKSFKNYRPDQERH